jgi:hypothetical protein
LIENSSFVLKSIVDGCQVDSIYTDFSKAFDRVSHCLLLDKISGDIEPAVNGSVISRNILVTFGATGQPFGATMLHLVCELNSSDL